MLSNFSPTVNPDNRFKFIKDEELDDIIIGGSINHVFNLPFSVSDYTKYISLTYRQGFENILNIIDYEILNNNTLLFKLTPEDTKKFKLTSLNTSAQLKVITKEDNIIFSEPRYLKVYKPINEENN